MQKHLLKLLKAFFLLLVFFFIGKYLYQNINELRALEFKLNIPIFIFSIFFFLIYKIYNASLWHYITLKSGCSISYEKAVVSWCYSLLGKYIPGKVLYLGGRLYFYKNENKSMKSVTFCFLLENICTLLAAAFIFLLSFSFVELESLKQYKLPSLLFILFFFVIINPRLLEFGLNRVLKLLKRPPLELSFTYFDMFWIVFLFITNWLVLGLGFYWLVHSLYPVGFEHFFFLSGSFAISAMIGILVLFAPSGIGVREAVLVVTLQAIMPMPMAIVVSIVSRLWVTLAEMLTVLFAFIYAKVKRI